MTDTSRVATLISFDGQLTENAQIQVENIRIDHQACTPSKNNSIISNRYSAYLFL